MTSTSSARVCSKPEVRVLSSTSQSESLLSSAKLYAHYSAKFVNHHRSRYANILNRFGREAWLGTSIILRQVSPESEPIFDFIIQLYHSCDGDWGELRGQLGIADDELMRFLDFAKSRT